MEIVIIKLTYTTRPDILSVHLCKHAMRETNTNMSIIKIFLFASLDDQKKKTITIGKHVLVFYVNVVNLFSVIYF